MEMASKVLPVASGVERMSTRILATSWRLIRPTAMSPWEKMGRWLDGHLSLSPQGRKMV